MFCRNCGKELKEGTAVCPECGEILLSSAVAAAQNGMNTPGGDQNASGTPSWNNTASAQQGQTQPGGYTYDPNTGVYTYADGPTASSQGAYVRPGFGQTGTSRQGGHSIDYGSQGTYTAPGQQGSYTAPGQQGSYTAPGQQGSYTAPQGGYVPQGGYQQPGQQPGYTYDPATGTYTYANGTGNYGSPYQDKGRGAAIASVVCGVLGIILCCLSPIITLPLSIAAVICGILGMRSSQRSMAVVGLVCGVIGILLGIFLGVAILSMGTYDMDFEDFLNQL